VHKRLIPYRQGWPEPYMHTVYGRIYGKIPAKNTIRAPYIRINV